MHADLSPLIAATAHWLTTAYPACGGALSSALCEVQARQAVTVAAWLRYPTVMDAALVGMAGPGGSGRLDWITGADSATTAHGRNGETGETGETGQDGEDGEVRDAHAWRSWVDEVVASWAACLLVDEGLAALAVAALVEGDHSAGVPVEFRRLVTPDDRGRRAAALLRHPDLLAPVAELHHAQLRDLLRPLRPGQALIA